MKKLTRASKFKSLTYYTRKSQSTYGRGNTVSAVTSIKPTSNNFKQEHPELVEKVYEKLQNLKDEYRAFYNEEQELESLLEDLCVDCDEFINQLIKIFESYNKSIDTLSDFDKAFKTKHLEIIKEVISDYSDQLNTISVFIEADGKVRFYRSRLKKIYTDSPKNFSFIYEKKSGLIIQLYMAFHSVKAIAPDEASDMINHSDNHGLVIDRKC